MTVVLGTRGSSLALAQARLVAEALGGDVELRVVRTHGDDSARPIQELGDRRDGVFVTALEDALRRGEIDLAVHSLKDVPTDEREGLVIAAVPFREDPRDVLLTRDRRGLASLPHRARVGTGSPRRAAFLRALRPDIETADIRGNVETRLRKVTESEFDATLLALAGLRRLGVPVNDVEILSLEQVPPAPGQGALGVQCRSEDHGLVERLAVIDDRAIRDATAAERACLRALGGSCLVPLGTYGRVEDGQVVLDAALVRERVVRVRERGRDPEAVGERAGAELRQVSYAG